MRGVAQRHLFICRDCCVSLMGLVLTAEAAGVRGIGHVELPQGWQCAITAQGVSFLCRDCAALQQAAKKIGGKQWETH